MPKKKQNKKNIKKKDTEKQDQKPKRKHCNCGHYALASDKKNRCQRCKSLEDTQDRLRRVEQEKNQCQTVNKQLKAEVSTLKEKGKFPYWFHIKDSSFSCTRKYLNDLAQAIAPFADSIHMEWGKNP